MSLAHSFRRWLIIGWYRLFCLDAQVNNAKAGFKAACLGALQVIFLFVKQL